MSDLGRGGNAPDCRASGANKVSFAQGDTLRNFNTIHGSNHYDVLKGGDNYGETFYGHLGNDTMYGGLLGGDTLDGGEGNDTADYSAFPRTAFLIFDLSANAITGTSSVVNFRDVTLREHRERHRHAV